MAINRIAQAGWEWGLVLVEASAQAGALVVTAPVRSGDYALQLTGGQVTFTAAAATSQCRLAFHLYHKGAVAGQQAELVTLRQGGTTVLVVRWDNSQLTLACGSSLVATVAAPSLTQTQHWTHLGLDVKLHASSGWVKLYLDGVLTIDYSGQTTQGASACASLVLGNASGGVRWNADLVIDDLYWDDTTGEGNAAPPPDLRFVPIRPAANGAYSQLTGSDGDSTDNYLLVADGLPDGEESYVQSSTPGQKDSYAMQDVSVPTGWSVEAVIIAAQARKVDAAAATVLKLLARLGEVDVISASQPLAADFATLWHRLPSPPGGGSWDQAGVNGVELGVEVA